MLNKKIIIIALMTICIFTISSVSAVENGDEFLNSYGYDTGDAQAVESSVGDVDLIGFEESGDTLQTYNPEDINVTIYKETCELKTDDNELVLRICWPEDIPSYYPVQIDNGAGMTISFFHEAGKNCTDVLFRDLIYDEPGVYNFTVYFDGITRTDLLRDQITVIQTLRPVDFIELYNKDITDPDDYIAIVSDGYNDGFGLEGNVSMYANDTLVYTELFYGNNVTAITITQNWLSTKLSGKYIIRVDYNRTPSNGRVFSINQPINFINDVPNATFVDLADEIAATAEGGILTLTKDYIYAGGSTGGIPISKTITIDGQGHTLDGNYTSKIFSISSENVVLRNIKFINAHYDGEGGAVSGGNVLFCNFDRNYAEYGGAIANCSAVNCTFISNSANCEGGAIYKGSAVNCNFDNNRAVSGGAIAESSADNCVFTNNFASDYGGAMLAGKSVGCTFTHNSAITAGGALDAGTAINCTFINNSADNGGAMCGHAENSKFINNTALEKGGAMNSASAINCTFDGNSAQFSGGAIGDGTAIGSTFTNNHAVEGGAIGNGFAENCTFIGNYASDIGGAMIVEHDNVSVVGCRFINSQAKNKGGAIYFYSENCSLIDSYFINNTAAEGPDWYSVYDLNVVISTVLNVSSLCIPYGVSKDLTVTLTDGNGNPLSGKEIIASLNGKSYTSNTDSNGQASIAVPGDLNADTYSANVSYAGDSYYMPSNATSYVIVNKAKTSISAKSSDEKLIATLINDDARTPIAGANLIFNLDGKSYTAKTNSKGQTSISTGDLAPGTYTAVVSYKGNANFNPFTTDVEVVIKNDVNLSAYYVASSKELVVTMVDSITGNALKGASVAVDIDGKKYSVKISATGQGRTSLDDLDYGTYTATLSYKGNANYNPASASVELVVKDDVVLAADYDSITKELVVTLVDEFTGAPLKGASVAVDIDGEKYTVKITSTGQGTLSLEGLDYGTYTVALSYKGNAKYNAANITTDIDVKNNAALSVYADSNVKELVVTLVDGITGAPLKGASVAVDIGGEKYSVKINSKGEGTLSLTDFEAGTYTAAATYKGNAKYNAVNATADIVVKDYAAISVYSENRQLVVTLVDGITGAPLKGASVAVDIGGEKYSVKINSKGEGTLSLEEFDYGTYTATAIYKGNAKYYAVNATADIVVKDEIAISVYYDSENKELVVTASDAITGAPLKAATIVVNIAGENYNVKLNSKGLGTLSLADFDYGTYDVSATYKGNAKYAPSTVNVKIVVKEEVILSAVYDSAYEQIIVTLVDATTGSALKGANVVVNIAGKNNNVKITSTGQGILFVGDLAPGTYTATVTYKGNAMYYPDDTTLEVIISDG